MISTSGVKMCYWEMSNNTRGRERMPPTSGVLGCKIIWNKGSNPSTGKKRGHPNIAVESNNKKPRTILQTCFDELREGLHKANPEAYKPMLVSIGPCHLPNSNMQELKQWYLDSLLERRNEKSKERYIRELKKLEKEARECYGDPIGRLMGNDEFLEMMLLDGCFIIEFVRKGYLKHVGSEDIDDPILKNNLMEYHIRRDIMLLENQIPYFVLSRLYDMIKDPEEKPFVEMAMSVFTGTLLNNTPTSIGYKLGEQAL